MNTFLPPRGDARYSEIGIAEEEEDIRFSFRGWNGEAIDGIMEINLLGNV